MDSYICQSNLSNINTSPGIFSHHLRCQFKKYTSNARRLFGGGCRLTYCQISQINNDMNAGSPIWAISAEKRSRNCRSNLSAGWEECDNATVKQNSIDSLLRSLFCTSCISLSGRTLSTLFNCASLQMLHHSSNLKGSILKDSTRRIQKNFCI